MITIAVCTWNRARLVEKTLESFTRLKVPAGVDWEVVVINNNSPDATGETLTSFLGRLPLRVFLETNQGIAYARNRAAAEARGNVILWTDDDVEVPESWLRNYARALDQNPDCGFFGGAVELKFEGHPPVWLLNGLNAMGGALGQVRLPVSPTVGSGPELPFNCNMAVRREYHVAMPYDTRYGRKAGGLVSGEETVFLRGLLASGVKGLWLQDVAVQHAVPVERQSVAYLRRALNGVGQELAMRFPSRARREFLGVPLWLWRDAVTFEARFRLKRLARKDAGWHEDFVGAAISWGRIQRTIRDNRASASTAGGSAFESRPARI
jgi:glucosyl-dolichyl phosphate glucuronosyltransferase